LPRNAVLGVYGGIAGRVLVFSSYTEGVTRLAARLFRGNLGFYFAKLLGFSLFGTLGWFALQYVT
jgi:hypothetical protein